MYWSFKELELPDSWITAFCLSCFIASRLKKWRLWLWPKSFTKLRSTNLHCYSRQSLQFKETCRGESLCRVLVMHFEQLFTFYCEMVFFSFFFKEVLIFTLINHWQVNHYSALETDVSKENGPTWWLDESELLQNWGAPRMQQLGSLMMD